MRLCEAKTYKIPAVLDGVPVTVYLRVFVEDGKAVVLRSANVLVGEKFLPRIDVGIARWDELEAAMARADKEGR